MKRLCLMAKHAPTLWKKVNGIVTQESDGNSETPEQDNSPSWCVCGQCREMPKGRERVCCRNKEYSHHHPLSELHVLLEPTLELAMRNNADHLHYPFDPSNNACWHFTAYRQYSLWAWGRLGRSNRKVIPSCCVWLIRDRFPDQNNNHTGFFDVEYNL